MLPLNTYVKVLQKDTSKLEKIAIVEKLSWQYLLLNVICASIFSSYAFKIESIELAMVNVFCKFLSLFLLNLISSLGLLSNIFLLAIYLSVKPSQSLII